MQKFIVFLMVPREPQNDCKQRDKLRKIDGTSGSDFSMPDGRHFYSGGGRGFLDYTLLKNYATSKK